MKVIFQDHGHLPIPIISKSLLADLTILIDKFPTVVYILFKPNDFVPKGEV